MGSYLRDQNLHLVFGTTTADVSAKKVLPSGY